MKSEADDWNRASTAIFDRTVQVPGYVLPAGVYVLKLADISGDHNVVQIWNGGQTELVATVLGYPEYMSTTPTEDLFTFGVIAEGEPIALLSWFHRGNPNGERFIYPVSPKK
jgi:hypothetical protein